MFVLIVGCGRVGSRVAFEMMVAGHEVSILDENEESHALLDYRIEKETPRVDGERVAQWEDRGRFTLGTALEHEALEEAGIEQADVVVCSTDGDNTNIVVAQIAHARYQVPKVVARVLDPMRAQWYSERGLNIVCPTQIAIDMLNQAVSGTDQDDRAAVGEPESDGRAAG